MKLIKLFTLSICTLSLTACFPPTGQFFGEQKDYLKNDLGQIVRECTDEINPMTGKTAFNGVAKSRANGFWMRNNLPKGTLYYVCEGAQTVLPKDCQGKPLNTPEIRRYWKKYNLPTGTTKFDCSSGVPKVANDS